MKNKEEKIMLNQVTLIGRLLKDVEIKEGVSGKKYTNITLAVPRSFKNIDGEYETDFINCITFGTVAENVNEYCKKGDLIGIKGRIESTNNNIRIIAEKVTFLSNSK
jgi:single-strand DNA-binding protein